MSDRDETFTEASDGCSLQSDPISRFIKNIHVLLDSKKKFFKQKKAKKKSLERISSETFWNLIARPSFKKD